MGELGVLSALQAGHHGLGPPPAQAIRVLKGLPDRSARYILRPTFFGFRQSFIAMGAEDSLIYIWHRNTGDLLQTLEGHTGTVNAVAAHPKIPGLLVSASDDKTVHIWGTPGMAGEYSSRGNQNDEMA